MIRQLLIGMAGWLCRLANWRYPTTHVGFSWHNGTLRVTYLERFGLEDYRRALCPKRANPKRHDLDSAEAVPAAGSRKAAQNSLRP